MCYNGRHAPLHTDKFNSSATLLWHMGRRMVRACPAHTRAHVLHIGTPKATCMAQKRCMSCPPQDVWPVDEVVRAKVKADFDSDPTIGDRRQELVFIGQDLKVHTCMHACMHAYMLLCMHGVGTVV